MSRRPGQLDDNPMTMDRNYNDTGAGPTKTGSRNVSNHNNRNDGPLAIPSSLPSGSAVTVPTSNGNSNRSRRHSGAGPALSVSIEQARREMPNPGSSGATNTSGVSLSGSATMTAPTPIKAILADDPKKVKKSRRSLTGTNLVPNGPFISKSVGLFSHLVQFQEEEAAVGMAPPLNVHAAVIRFALRSRSYKNLGGAQRCREMLLALREAIRDYRANPEMAICRHLDGYLKPMIGYMVEARPMAIAMANAVRALRHQISVLPVEMAEHEAQAAMYVFIDNFLTNRLELADRLIIQFAQSKIVDGDVILTFARSTVVRDLLVHAKQRAGRHFRVIIVDSRPFQEGARLLEELVAAGISSSYVPINAIAYVIKEVTKTIIGAAGIYANGTLLSRTGTAAVCALSRRSNVPVIVCCETIKFSDRLQIDSFVFNELGDPDALVRPDASDATTLSGWKSIDSLKLLNILYDVTPSEYVTVVITEIGLIPVTSIPVVLREYSSSTAMGGAVTTTYSHTQYSQQTPPVISP